MLVLDAGGVSRLAERSSAGAARIALLKEASLWPPTVPSVVLVETLTGRVGPDAPVNRFLKACDVLDRLPTAIARRAAALRHHARLRPSGDDLPLYPPETVAGSTPGADRG